MVSIDAGTREKYKEIRGRDLFDNLISNLEKYAEVKNKDNKAKLALKYIFTDNNLEESEIDGFIEICKKIQPCQTIMSIDFTKPNNMETKNKILAETREKLIKEGINVRDIDDRQDMLF